MTEEYLTKEEFNKFKDNHFAHFLADFAVVKSQVKEHRYLLVATFLTVVATLIRSFTN